MRELAALWRRLLVKRGLTYTVQAATAPTALLLGACGWGGARINTRVS